MTQRIFTKKSADKILQKFKLLIDKCRDNFEPQKIFSLRRATDQIQTSKCLEKTS